MVRGHPAPLTACDARRAVGGIGSKAITAARRHHIAVFVAFFCLPLSVGRVAVEATSPAPPRQPVEELRDLVAELGEEHWFRREAAQRQLLDLGPAAVPYLEQVVGSSNLELAYRARDLLDRIAPQVVDFELLWIDLGAPLAPSPKLAATAVTTLPPGQEGRLQLQPTASYTQPQWETRPFAISYNRALEGRLDIRIEKVAAGASGNRLELYRPLTGPRTVSLVKRSEVSIFRTRGTALERDRQRFLLVLTAAYRRETSVPRRPLPETAEAAYETLLEQLRVQATAKDRDERLAALQLLAELRAPNSTEVFQQALQSPETRSVAALGLGGVARWSELIKGPDAQAAAAVASVAGKHPSLSVPLQAATRLAASGEEAGYQYLVEKLLSEDSNEVHFAMSALSDVLLGGVLVGAPASASLLDRLFTTVGTDEFLGRSVWQHREIEHFLSTIIHLLDPADAEDRTRLQQLQDAFERLAVGNLGTATTPFALALSLWRRAQEKLTSTPGAEAEFALRLLPKLSAKNLMNQAQNHLQRILNKQVDEGAIPLERVLLVFRQQFDADSKSATDALNLFLSFARRAQPGPDSIRPLVETLVKGGSTIADSQTKGIGATSRTSLLRRVESQLSQWVPLPRKGRPAAQFDVAWREWLNDEAAVTAHQKKLSAAAETTDTDQPLSLYYFVLQSDGRTEPATTSQEKAKHPKLQIIEARLFDPVSNTVRFVDTHGNSQQLRLTTPRTSGPNKTYRIETGGFTATVRSEEPLLRPQPRPDFAPRIYENSDLLMGSRYLSSATTTRYRLLLMVSNAAAPPAASAGDANDRWRWFLENRLLQLPPTAAPNAADATIRVLTTLGIRETLPLLRQVFEKNPTATRARQLYELGDARGLVFLKSQLSEQPVGTRKMAARILCEIGVSDGVQALLSLLAEAPPPTKGRQGISYSDLRALELYLAQQSAPSTERRTILEFLFLQIEHANWQHTIFRTLEREAKTDFGYRTARTLNNEAERGVAVARAVRAAKEWWSTERQTETEQPIVDPPPPAPLDAKDPIK